MTRIVKYLNTTQQALLKKEQQATLLSTELKDANAKLKAANTRNVGNALINAAGPISSDKMPVGIDINEYAGLVDWDTIRRHNLAFAYVRATYANSHSGRQSTVDAAFNLNWTSLRAASIPRGAFIIFRAAADPAEEADTFFKTIDDAGGFLPDDLTPIIYVDSTDANSPDFSTHLKDLIERFVQHYNRRPIIHATQVTFDKLKLVGFYDCPISVAKFSNTPPKLEGKWRTWLLWQFTQTGSIDGVEVPVTFDRLNGTLGGLRNDAVQIRRDGSV